MNPENTENSRRLLVDLLQIAHAGERAAAYAYRGHWKSVRRPEERDSIRTIEEDEWHHREWVAQMLQKLGALPNRSLEIKAWVIGRVLGFLCHCSGWFAPMYGAGRLESLNVKEYEVAARHARDGGHPEFSDCLLKMAEVEWDHEKYFRSQAERHFLARYLPLWQSPPPRETIRLRFSSEAG